MVSFSHAEPVHSVTVFSDDDGRFRTPTIRGEGPFTVRVRRIGWRDSNLVDVDLTHGLSLILERETDPAAVAAQLPANHWYALVLDSIEDRAQREELKQQCTNCHQQGNWATRPHDPRPGSPRKFPARRSHDFRLHESVEFTADLR
jgi:hypothetical protein